MKAHWKIGTKASDSKLPEKRDSVYVHREELANLSPNCAYVHLSGLSSKVTEKDIMGFFAYQRIIPKGIKRAVVSGKPSDEAFIIFVDDQSANQACKLAGEYLAGKMLKITKKDKPSLEDFINRNFISPQPFPIERKYSSYSTRETKDYSYNDRAAS